MGPGWHDGAKSADGPAFTFLATIQTKFTFEKALAALSPDHRSPSLKRRRALSDVDGGAGESKKKRRLRLVLITSRLSRPFSAPASNIANRGNSKIAVGAKNKSLGRNLLRRAAIMNSIRLRDRSEEAKVTEWRNSGRAWSEAIRLQQMSSQRPRLHDIPLPPSPLGLTNYDALDLEDEMVDADGESTNEGLQIYSDFNIMDPVTNDDAEDECFDKLDSIPQNLPEDRRPPSPPDERIIEMLVGEEQQKDGIFVRLEG